MLTAISLHADIDNPDPSICLRAYSFGSDLKDNENEIYLLFIDNLFYGSGVCYWAYYLINLFWKILTLCNKILNLYLLFKSTHFIRIWIVRRNRMIKLCGRLVCSAFHPFFMIKNKYSDCTAQQSEAKSTYQFFIVEY